MSASGLSITRRFSRGVLQQVDELTPIFRSPERIKVYRPRLRAHDGDGSRAGGFEQCLRQHECIRKASAGLSQLDERTLIVQQSCDAHDIGWQELTWSGCVRNEIREIRHSRASFRQRTLNGCSCEFRICLTRSGCLAPRLQCPTDVAGCNPQPMGNRAPAAPDVYGEAAHESLEELLGRHRLPG